VTKINAKINKVVVGMCDLTNPEDFARTLHELVQQWEELRPVYIPFRDYCRERTRMMQAAAAGALQDDEDNVVIFQPRGVVAK